MARKLWKRLDYSVHKMSFKYATLKKIKKQICDKQGRKLKKNAGSKKNRKKVEVFLYETSTSGASRLKMVKAELPEIFRGKFPIEQFFDHGIDIIGAFVLVIEIISMFPNVNR